METTNTHKRTELSATTAIYVEALEYLEQAETAFINAVSAHYGDAQGEQIYNEKAAAFDVARDMVRGYFLQSVTDNLRENDSNQI